MAATGRGRNATFRRAGTDSDRPLPSNAGPPRDDVRGWTADFHTTAAFGNATIMEDQKASRGHMDRHPQNDWGSVGYDARFDVYWVPAGGALQRLSFCPWCGEQLPPSQRDRWFDELEAMGIDPDIHPIPELYRSGAWRNAPAVSALPRQGGAIEGRYINFFELPEDAGDGM